MNMFRDRQQKRLFWILVAATGFVAGLVFVRLTLNHESVPFFPGKTGRTYSILGGQFSFFFLMWNLFLAWLPYLVALQAERWQRDQTGWLAVGLALLFWLAFFPNAPYIVTDLVHLRHRPPVPFWYDLIILFTGAFTGLMLGFFSLYEVQIVLRRVVGARWVWPLTVGAIGLCSFGIWLGRFQRWNSWDIVANPTGLVRDLFHTLTQRHELAHALGISALFSGLLLLGFGLLSVMMERR